MIDSQLLEVIVCPQCDGDLRYTREDVLVCMLCRVYYPVDEGTPDLRASSAVPLKSKSNQSSFVINKIQIELRGEQGVVTSYLEPQTCRVIGRSTFDEVSTQIISNPSMIPFDDQIKKIVSHFVRSQEGSRKLKTRDAFVGFERLPDIIIPDIGVSRLHAMIFFDGTQVGILDLVSRNGTYLNNKEIESANLDEGDEVVVGQTRIIIKKGKL